MDNKLIHHGILGQKWGVRRTDEQLERAAKSTERKPKASSMTDEELTSKVKRMTLEKTYKTLSKEREPKSALEKTKKAVDSASTLANQLKTMNKNAIDTRPKNKLDLSRMTDQELRDRITRTNLERQYNDMFAEKQQVSKGRDFATKVIDGAGTALAVGSSALAIALAIKELKKK